MTLQWNVSVFVPNPASPHKVLVSCDYGRHPNMKHIGIELVGPIRPALAESLLIGLTSVLNAVAPKGPDA